jgi:NADH:ubiquinone oxidoreductase subunit 6 (subunit J)
MLTRVRDAPTTPVAPQQSLGLAVAASLFGLLATAILLTDWGALGATEEITLVPVRELGKVLFQRWSVPFEVASLVLLVALLGAIVLARPEEEE